MNLSVPVRASILDRAAVRRDTRRDEEKIVAERLEQAQLSPGAAREADAIARNLVGHVRGAKPAGLDAFLHAYDLGSDEGVALMCLAEALLRIPDAHTADELIRDKLSGPDWSEKLGDSPSPFVNAATFSLLLTGKVLDAGHDNRGTWSAALGRAVGRLGEPVIRTAVGQAMKILGGQFVFGRTIDEALERAAPERKKGLSHSFDMLGEAARTLADADRYAEAYRGAIRRIAREAGEGVVRSPGISVKLSALHPRYEALHAEEAKAYVLPVLRELAAAASAANVHLTIDAEESDRLELQMDCLEALVADDALFANGWTGLGMALQAYAKRARPVAEWVVALARAHGRTLMIRLVKGAYWDSEIKVAQVGGYDDYPVFTRKVATDVSYLACAKVLLGAPDCIYPAFATHNATTIGAIKALAGTTPFEFQRLHGMGEELFEGLAKLERELGQPQTPVRIYAPVGSHKELLAYLVRRLLENGANSSFVNRIADAEIGVDDLIRDPVTQLTALSPRRNPAIALPGEMFGTARRNSAGCDLTDIAVREPLLRRLAELERKRWTAGEGSGARTEVRSPFDHALLVGEVIETVPADLDAMLSRAAGSQGAWDAIGGEARARLLDRTADLFEAHREEFYSLCIREAGKSLPDAVLEVREAVDFLRYYAAEGRRLAQPVHLPGPTGELNELRHHGRGVWTCISPWNFPLAIFTGPVAAALAAGNSAIAKPAEQTPLIGALAVRLMHEAGIPADVVQLAVGNGRIGAALVSHRLTSGVAFTGSTAVARAINRSLAEREGPIVPLIAETGGQNAMIVDSSALPEQVTRDVVASAFQSAGQRCSALRVLFVQDDVADTMLTMIRGAMEALSIGDPRLPTTDVGPVIDGEAKASLDAHVAVLRAAGQVLAELPLPTNNGSFVAPVIAELPSLASLKDEHFGPILHVIRWKSGEIDKVIDQINATGFGLTLGLQSRIDTVAEHVARRARVGNLYINRNQIGAVVESQPFGGEGLSGTGPKAGGPHYVARFATERVTCIDTTAAGGNATLMAAID
ncbi:RHH-type proline utilization regulon transcriptional repressor/proline dehydrogenase/delta 1-pyrroline-5-carboxylate dehydrogenase [Sphingomonas kaistensis]|uniref:Bifunctional protein PutA n=1 Tax=Sphingomonas kaistensis TaxID=298708 RepID=A0A7X5Y700_9SPHN|nr:bifunctional proline dehydrogenase/L-glutamate gamma-semialdehyde dehydrogenase PutA [Sphingomonas kaistensis]NJC06374.1 RHH-type proline utilization regulon transcriptional repressor/proline dehydrogenase/delta 1-pyrroline-5-carboxylate dehydrogenase [Sphingomonas kaistensis]